jgi:hydrogenase nickel incorporation protein HypA/HybF
MHEFKLVEDILRDVLKAAEKNKGQKVSIVRLRVGEKCHAQPENIEFLFKQAARGSIAEKAKLEITVIPGEDLALASIQID